MPNVIPEKMTKFQVYADDGVLLGIAEGNFPSLEFMTTEIKGAGIAGTIDSPGGGMFGSLTLTLKWRITTQDFTSLLEPVSHTLDLYAEHASYDAGRGEYLKQRFHVYMKALTKKGDYGKLADMESQDGSTEHEIYYMKVDIDGKELLELDKYNFIFSVNGTDYLAETRRNLGMM